MPSIAEAWEGYHRTVLDPDADPAVVRETRRAFYAGAWLMFRFGVSLGGDDVSDDRRRAGLDQLWRELEAHYFSVGTPWEGAHRG